MKTKGQLAGCVQPAPHGCHHHLWRQRARHVTAGARRLGAAAILAPETSILHKTVNRLSLANRVLLGSWMVDICQEGCSLRSGPQRRYMAHLRWCYHSTPGKPSSWALQLVTARIQTQALVSKSVGFLFCLLFFKLAQVISYKRMTYETAEITKKKTEQD